MEKLRWSDGSDSNDEGKTDIVMQKRGWNNGKYRSGGTHRRSKDADTGTKITGGYDVGAKIGVGGPNSNGPNSPGDPVHGASPSKNADSRPDGKEPDNTALVDKMCSAKKQGRSNGSDSSKETCRRGDSDCGGDKKAGGFCGVAATGGDVGSNSSDNPVSSPDSASRGAGSRANGKKLEAEHADIMGAIVQMPSCSDGSNNSSINSSARSDGNNNGNRKSSVDSAFKMSGGGQRDVVGKTTSGSSNSSTCSGGGRNGAGKSSGGSTSSTNESSLHLHTDKLLPVGASGALDGQAPDQPQAKQAQTSIKNTTEDADHQGEVSSPPESNRPQQGVDLLEAHHQGESSSAHEPVKSQQGMETLTDDNESASSNPVEPGNASPDAELHAADVQGEGLDAAESGEGEQGAEEPLQEDNASLSANDPEPENEDAVEQNALIAGLLEGCSEEEREMIERFLAYEFGGGEDFAAGPGSEEGSDDHENDEGSEYDEGRDEVREHEALEGQARGGERRGWWSWLWNFVMVFMILNIYTAVIFDAGFPGSRISSTATTMQKFTSCVPFGRVIEAWVARTGPIVFDVLSTSGSANTNNNDDDFGDRMTEIKNKHRNKNKNKNKNKNVDKNMHENGSSDDNNDTDKDDDKWFWNKNKKNNKNKNNDGGGTASPSARTSVDTDSRAPSLDNAKSRLDEYNKHWRRRWDSFAADFQDMVDGPSI